MGKNKAKAHDLAIKWWKKTKRSSAVCDRCGMTDISKGEGYLCDPSTASMASVTDLLGRLGHTDIDLGKLGISNDNPDLLCESCFDNSEAEPFKGKI